MYQYTHTILVKIDIIFQCVVILFSDYTHTHTHRVTIIMMMMMREYQNILEQFWLVGIIGKYLDIKKKKNQELQKVLLFYRIVLKIHAVFDLDQYFANK